MTVPYVTIVEGQATQAIPDPGIDKICIVIGTSSAGTAGLSALRLNPTSLVTDYGTGDAIDASTHLLAPTNKRKNAFPIAFYKTPSTNPGSYRTIDVTGVTGTALVTVDATSTPLGTYDAWLKVPTGFTVGTAGGAIQWSLDGGRHWSDTIAIGTADFYLIPNSGVKFLFNPSASDVTAVYTLVNEAFTDHNAHVILTTGTVHSTADTVDAVSAGTYPSATTPATAVARMNAVIAAAKLHAIKGTGGTPATHINLGGDTTYLASLNAITVATDIETTLTAALAFKAAHNIHINGATAWHTIGDATNVITSPAPLPGTLIAADIVKVRTNAPVWAQADLTTAFTTIAQSTIDAALIMVIGDVAAADLTIISAGLNALLLVGKRASVATHSRGQLTAESESTWQAAVIADRAAFSDARIGVCDGQAWVTNPYTGRTDLRSFIAPFMARTTSIDRWVSPGYVGDGPLDGVSLVDTNGALVGHDEGPGGAVTGLDNARGICLYRIPNPILRTGAYVVTSPQVLWGTADSIRHWQIRRIANAMEREAEAISWAEIGGATLGDPVTLLLDEVAADAISNKIRGVLSVNFANDIQNPKDDNLVIIDRPFTIVNVTDVYLTGTINPLPYYYVKGITLTFRINTGV